MREPNIYDAVDKLLSFVWSATMMGGCAYFVFIEGASAWWFVLAVLLAASWKTNHRKELELYYGDDDEV